MRYIVFVSLAACTAPLAKAPESPPAEEPPGTYIEFTDVRERQPAEEPPAQSYAGVLR